MENAMEGGGDETDFVDVRIGAGFETQMQLALQHLRYGWQRMGLESLANQHVRLSMLL